MQGGVIMGRFKPNARSMFLNECVDVVEKGRINDVQITKVSIEGVYGGEIFRFSYTPEEEGYEEEAIRSSTQ